MESFGWYFKEFKFNLVERRNYESFLMEVGFRKRYLVEVYNINRKRGYEIKEIVI